MTWNTSRRYFLKQTGMTLLASPVLKFQLNTRVSAEEILEGPGLRHYPSPPIHKKTNWIDVTKAPYFADNTGKKNCTQVLLRAMKDLHVLSRGRTAHYNVLSALYLPNGVYLVSNKLTFGEGRARSMHLRGESQEGTIIRLKPGSDGYQDPNNPKPVITFFDSKGGTSNDAFNNAIDNLTVEVGSGNRGAVGIVFHNNNNGYIQGLTIKSLDGAGVDALRLTYGAAGIGYIKNLSISGFDYGVTLAHSKIAYVFEHIELNGQRKAGFHNNGKPVQIRGLLSNNHVPAIQNVNQGGQIVLLDSRLNSRKGQVAIDNQAGALFVRNVVTSGYTHGIKNSSKLIPAGRIEEYNGGPIYTLRENTPKKSLNLPIKETPAIPWEDPLDWAYVRPGNNDDTSAIQAAIDSGKRTVCILPGTYRIKRPIRLRGSVERLYGSYAHLRIPEARTKLTPEDKFSVIVEDSRIPIRIIEMLGCGCIQNKSSNTLVLRFVQCQGYRNTGYGDLFLEGVQGDLTNLCNTAARMPVWLFKDQKVWVRHINPEGAYPHITNDGGQLWIMGYKVGELLGPYIVSLNGAKTEVLGGYCNGLSPIADEQRPMFINDNSDMTLIAAEGIATWYGPTAQSPFATAIRELKNGQERSLSHKAVLKRKNNANKGALIPFYNGRVAVRPNDETSVTITVLAPRTGRLQQNKGMLRIERQGRRDSDLEVFLYVDGDSTFATGEYQLIPSSVTIPRNQRSVDLEISTQLSNEAANGRRELVVGITCSPQYRIREQSRIARLTLENNKVALEKGIRLNYRFEEEIGRDHSGNGFHAEKINNVKALREGKLPATIFENNSQMTISTKFSYGQNTYMKMYADKSVCFWLKPKNINRQQTIYTEGGGASGLKLVIDKGNIEAILHERVGIRAYVTNALELNQWQHVAMVFSHGSLSLYLDGMLVGTDHAPVARMDYIYQRRLIAGLGMGTFQGYLADFRVYQRPLNSAEVSALKALVSPV